MITAETNTLLALENAHANLLKQVDAALSVHGIRFTEFLVLHQLSLAPKQVMRRVELAEAVGLTASGVTRLLLPLEKIGLVTKEANPRDARVSLVKLAPGGASIYADALVTVQHVAETLLQGLESKQREQLLNLLQAL
ncbi:MAG: MarR family transcriptional regulator [Lysobacterales bacterium]|jgi:DNA-binding MarR family transcriptional regulator